MSGAEFIGCVQLRAGVLPTAKRASRGRPARRVDCDACGRIETVGHILQVCPRTWGHRIRRHNNLCNFVAGKLTRKGYRAPLSFQSMTELGLSQNDLKLISVKTVTDGVKTYIAHRRGTHRRPAYEAHRL